MINKIFKVNTAVCRSVKTAKKLRKNSENTVPVQRSFELWRKLTKSGVRAHIDIIVEHLQSCSE
ncbi:hypothetical protein B0H34DRAFT_496368 [Crassisporium funariophilum]|nr:hypothetical protein B0H34DRAFT_496368 [Crassisporium funariophilum]